MIALAVIWIFALCSATVCALFLGTPNGTVCEQYGTDAPACSVPGYFLCWLMVLSVLAVPAWLSIRRKTDAFANIAAIAGANIVVEPVFIFLLTAHA